MYMRSKSLVLRVRNTTLESEKSNRGAVCAVLLVLLFGADCAAAAAAACDGLEAACVHADVCSCWKRWRWRLRAGSCAWGGTDSSTTG